MPPDPTRIADTKAWLTKARQDLRRGEILLGAEPPDVEGALYHCQQAAEKAFKTFLTWHDLPFRRVHELDVIGGHCVDLDPTLKDLADRADILTKYAWRFRYPAHHTNRRWMRASRRLRWRAKSWRQLRIGCLPRCGPELAFSADQTGRSTSLIRFRSCFGVPRAEMKPEKPHATVFICS
jgi:HEPN domain-containing protein